MPCPTTHGRQSPVRARFVPGPSRSCNSSDTAIAIPRVSRAYRLARWHRFVSIERRQPLQTALQGISARAMVCRKVSELPRTAVSARSLTFLQFIWHGNRHSTGLQGIFARAMAPICVHRAPQTPPDIAPGHIRSRDDLQEARRPASHGPQSPVSYFPAIHLAPQSPFYRPPGHIRSRDGIDLCPSGTANPSRHRSRAYRLAR